MIKGPSGRVFMPPNAQIKTGQAAAKKATDFPVVDKSNPRDKPSLVRAEGAFPRGKEGFKTAADFIAGLMPKEGQAGVRQNYWLEVRDPKHRDRASLNGLDEKTGARQEWKEANHYDEKEASWKGEVGGEHNANLFKWIDNHPEIKIKMLEGKDKHPLSEKLGFIKFLDKQEAQQYNVNFAEGKWKSGNSLLDTTGLAGKAGMEGHAVIVMHTDGEIFSHPYEKGKWQHTSTTQGRPVLSAGMIKVEDGRATSFHLDSGHYMPNLTHLKNLLTVLQNKGIDVSDIALHSKKHSQDELNQVKMDVLKG